MADNHLTLFCLVDGEATSRAFSVDIDRTKSVDYLKKLVKLEKTPRFNDVAPDELILWRVSIPDDNQVSARIDTLDGKEKLNNPRTRLSELFPEHPDDKTYIIVQRPPQALKRDREEDEGRSSKRKRLDTDTLIDAIKEAGLAEKALEDGESDLSCLDNKERASLLKFIGKRVDRTDAFASLSRTAVELQGANIKNMDKISAPPGLALPVIRTKDLYVRQAYKDLYDTILGKFEDDRPYNPDNRNHIVVTGTSGIGKSAFLVYFTIRLLAESDDDNPPLIIFHTKRIQQCFVFGGRSTVRSGNIEDFRPFLNLADTWYLVDSTPDPELLSAKTIISASPKTLSSEAQHYQDVDKRVTWRYYMAPWDLKELKICRSHVAAFKVVPVRMLKELHLEIGGVPRYVLESPMTVLGFNPKNYEDAKIAACLRVDNALKGVTDPITLMRYFAQGKETLEFSSRLIHRWPSHDHSSFRLEWASSSIATKVSSMLTDGACGLMLKKLIEDPDGSASGIMFEAYVLRTFREGGHKFERKDLQTGEPGRLTIPRKPIVNSFRTISPANAKTGRLWIPKIRNYACVDLLMPPTDLFQVTVSSNHPIKGPPLLKLMKKLENSEWIAAPGDARLIFIVPSHVYEDFRRQKYLTSAGTVYKKNVPFFFCR